MRDDVRAKANPTHRLPGTFATKAGDFLFLAAHPGPEYYGSPNGLAATHWTRITSGQAHEASSDRYSNRMTVSGGIVMDGVESTLSQLRCDFLLSEEVDVLRLEPITNFRGLPTKYPPY
jgi:hypothetical protein